MEQFVNRFCYGTIKEFFVDFSIMYGRAKLKEEREMAKNSYMKGIPFIFKALNNSLKMISPESLDRVSIKFFGFLFEFENSKIKNLSRYKFYYYFKLLKQNLPILNFKEAFDFSGTLKSRLRILKQYGIFNGMIFNHEDNMSSYKKQRRTEE